MPEYFIDEIEFYEDWTPGKPVPERKSRSKNEESKVEKPKETHAVEAKVVEKPVVKEEPKVVVETPKVEEKPKPAPKEEHKSPAPKEEHKSPAPTPTPVQNDEKVQKKKVEPSLNTKPEQPVKKEAPPAKPAAAKHVPESRKSGCCSIF